MITEAVAEKLYTLEEYLAFCETHEGRFEFVDGEIIEMSEKSERWYIEFYDHLDQVISLPYFETEIPVNSVYKKIVFQPES